MKLNLKRPLIFLDIEATGLNVTQDRIVEVSMLKANPNGSQESRTWKVNPGKPIPDKIAKMIGVTNEDVAGLPAFKSIAHDILQFMEGADLAGFDLYRLDLPLLMEELNRSDIDFDITKRKIVDVQRIFHMMEKRNLAAAYQFYCGKNLDNVHTAEADVTATYEVFLSQLERYESLGDDVDKISAMTVSPAGNNVDIVGRMVMNENNEETFNFGKYRGQTVESVLKKDPGFYGWMMNGDFPAYTKKKLTEIRLRMKNK